MFSDEKDFTDENCGPDEYIDVIKPNWARQGSIIY